MTHAPSRSRRSTVPATIRTIIASDAAGIVAAVAAFAIVVTLARTVDGGGLAGQEAFCYWVPTLADPYALSDWTSPVAYVYSPAFIQALAPLKVLPWQLFLAAWTALLLFAVRFLSGPRLFAVAVLFAGLEIGGGNIHLLLAVAIVLGFRWPAAWALVLLTKVTPGIGLAWFAVRREWRNLAIALAATAAVVAVSLTIAPTAWVDWVGVLVASTDKTTGTWSALPVPLIVRLPIALAVVTWGARTDRRWTVPVAAMIALPAAWFGSISMLLAVIPLARWESGRPLDTSGPATRPWLQRREIVAGRASAALAHTSAVLRRAQPRAALSSVAGPLRAPGRDRSTGPQ